MSQNQPDTSLEIHIDPESLERRPSGTILGRIFVSYNHVAFPDQDWSDFPVVILGWWLRQLGALAAGESRAEFKFMDGPYRFDITATNNSWVVSLLETSNSTETYAGGPVDSSRFRDSLLGAADRLLRACRERGWPSDSDLTELATALHDSRSWT
jgi:hypothetical protein